jgi:hypothetical protein
VFISACVLQTAFSNNISQSSYCLCNGKTGSCIFIVAEEAFRFDVQSAYFVLYEYFCKEMVRNPLAGSRGKLVVDWSSSDSL